MKARILVDITLEVDETRMTKEIMQQYMSHLINPNVVFEVAGNRICAADIIWITFPTSIILTVQEDKDVKTPIFGQVQH